MNNKYLLYKHICERSILRACLITIYDIYKFYNTCKKKGIYLICGLRGVKNDQYNLYQYIPLMSPSEGFTAL